ncbi:MAG: hypothetical protein INR62_13045 [Rhodospirillales bacterium]|nr:hypothetical protein [Acetobacter sp.]
MLTHEGRFREALHELGIAQRLEPTSSAILTTRALALGLSGQKEQSSAMLNDAIALESEGSYRNSATMHGVMGELSLLQPRNIPRFLAENALAADLRRDREAVKRWEAATQTYRVHGETAMWQALLAMETSRSGTGTPTYALARYQAELGAQADALQTLETLYARHDPRLIGLTIDPLLARLRNQQRFVKILAAMGLPKTDAG